MTDRLTAAIQRQNALDKHVGRMREIDNMKLLRQHSPLQEQENNMTIFALEQCVENKVDLNISDAESALAELNTIRAQLAEAQRRIKELETPTMFWYFDNPEHEAFDSPHNLICDGDFDEGEEVSFMTARSLPAVSVRVTRDNDGNYNYEYIDAAKGESNGTR